MLGDLKNCISTGTLPTKWEWKKSALKNMYEKTFCDWRFEVKLYSKLDIFRQVVLKMYDYVWWDLVKIYPKCKKPCITMLKSLCGSNILSVNTQHDVERKYRYCITCINEVEDIYHFVMICPMYYDIRSSLFNCIKSEIGDESFYCFNLLNDHMKMLVLLGLDYPIPKEICICSGTSVVCILI